MNFRPQSAMSDRRVKYDFDYPIRSKINRIRKLLYDAPEYIKERFQWDDESLWSLTHHQIGLELCNRLLSLEGISSQSVITDAMSSVGGNTIPFAKVFKRVNAVELNDTRRSMLKYNIDLYDIKNVRIFKGYYQSIAKKIKQDIVFFDPPWGLDYAKFNDGEMRIGIEHPVGVIKPIETLICHISTCAKYCMIKLPYNYDFDYFEKSIMKVGSIVDKVEYERPNSFVIIIVKFHL